jgi:hypothetical protein
MSPKLESPWKEFLEEFDSLLKKPVTFHCVRFAVVAAYGLRRATNDLDYFTLEPTPSPNVLVRTRTGCAAVITTK